MIVLRSNKRLQCLSTVEYTQAEYLFEIKIMSRRVQLADPGKNNVPDILVFTIQGKGIKPWALMVAICPCTRSGWVIRIP